MTSEPYQITTGMEHLKRQRRVYEQEPDAPVPDVIELPDGRRFNTIDLLMSVDERVTYRKQVNKQGKPEWIRHEKRAYRSSKDPDNWPDIIFDAFANLTEMKSKYPDASIQLIRMKQRVARNLYENSTDMQQFHKSGQRSAGGQQRNESDKNTRTRIT